MFLAIRFFRKSDEATGRRANQTQLRQRQVQGQPIIGHEKVGHKESDVHAKPSEFRLVLMPNATDPDPLQISPLPDNPLLDNPS